MTPVAAKRDPRSIVTPDAFHISKELLGLKLAPPGKRLLALFIDLMVISILTAVTRSFALILGVVAAVLFIRAGFKRTTARGTVFSKAMRGSVGCLGVVIGVFTIIVWVSFGPRGGSNDDDEGPSVAGLGIPGGGGVLGTIATAVVEAAFAEAGSLAEAESATRDFAEAAEELGMPLEDLRTVLVASVPEDAPWADEAPAMFARVLPAPPAESADQIESRDAMAIRDEVSLYTTDEALEAYQVLLASGRVEDMDRARRAALQDRLASEIAADTLRILEASVAALTDVVAEAQEDLRETEAELDEIEGRGAFSSFRSFLDELGFGFGWASLYFTVMLSWWKGQTIGKRALRIRVLRLDGQPINWWAAFERAGGYAAGLATGLLGFAQVFWDANRQAIHDRIVGTVVAIDPPEKVLDWESMV